MISTIEQEVDEPDTGSVEKHITRLHHISGNTNSVAVRKELRRLGYHWYGADVGWAVTDEDVEEMGVTVEDVEGLAIDIPGFGDVEADCPYCQYPKEHDVHPAIGGKHHLKHLIAWGGTQWIPCRHIRTEEAPKL